MGAVAIFVICYVLFGTDETSSEFYRRTNAAIDKHSIHYNHEKIRAETDAKLQDVLKNAKKHVAQEAIDDPQAATAREEPSVAVLPSPPRMTDGEAYKIAHGKAKGHISSHADIVSDGGIGRASIPKPKEKAVYPTGVEEATNGKTPEAQKPTSKEKAEDLGMAEAKAKMDEVLKKGPGKYMSPVTHQRRGLLIRSSQSSSSPSRIAHTVSAPSPSYWTPTISSRHLTSLNSISCPRSRQ